MSELFHESFQQVICGENLSEGQSYDLFVELMDGKPGDVRVSGLLSAMATKGHTVEELTGAARAMREYSIKIDIPGDDILDIVGTGGTGISTFNVSTTTCLVAAGAGACVAKHGNVTNTRASGSADVLIALGVNIEMSPETVARCVEQAGVGFCYARMCHPAMKNVANVRKQLAVRTIFNVLGPLTNPAGASRFLLGVYSDEWTELLAKAIGNLGARSAYVVHGADGSDEISITSDTRVSRLQDGQVSTFTISPGDYGLEKSTLDALSVSSPQQSADVVRSILDGSRGPCRDIVILNAAAALVLCDQATDIATGITMASESIDSGAAAEVLKKLVEISNG